MVKRICNMFITLLAVGMVCRKAAVHALAQVTNRTRAAWFAVCAATAGAVLAVLPAASLAIETEGEKEVKKVTEQVSTEGITIILAVLAGLVGLIALAIVLPKAVGFIKRFI